MTERDEILEEHPRFRRCLVLVALGAVLLLALLPGTRDLLHEQLRLQTLGPMAGQGEPDYKAIAARHPRDFQIQLVAAMDETRKLAAGAGGTRDVAPLLRLRARFGDSPSLLANLLRISTLKLSSGKRLKSYTRVRNYRNLAPGPAERALWPFYDEAAAAGERVDPQNAYFPFMRSVVLFALERDTEALAAIRRASVLPRWDEYLLDEAEGRWRMHELATGVRSARERARATHSLLLPHYPGLRAAAEAALSIAEEEELAGRRGQGLEIRRAVAACGEIMRAESACLIGSLVGARITSAGFRGLGGAPPEVNAQSAGRASPVLTRPELGYASYLKELGYPRDASFVLDLAQVHRSLRALTANSRIPDNSSRDPHGQLILWSILDQVLLMNLWWLALAGAIAALVGRTRWVRQGQPAPAPVWAATLALLAGLVGLGLQSIAFSPGYPLFLAPALFLITLYEARRWGAAEPGSLAAPLAGVVAIGAAIWGMMFLQQGVAEGIRAWFSLWKGEDAALSVWSDTRLLQGAAIPALLAAVLAICSLILRVPLAAGVVRGFRGAALPVACLLVLVYAGCVLVTAGHDQAVREETLPLRTPEGRVLAARIGLPWPDRVLPAPAPPESP